MGASVFFYSLISVIIVSLISLIGIVTMGININRIKNLLSFLVAFSAGILLADTFIHLLPEAVETNGFTLTVSLSIIAGILLFFILEQFVHWRHCHIPTSVDHPHPFAVMNLVGDSVHNFIDGMVIAGSYMVSIPLGIATTIAVIFHEIPQEIGDYGVLIHGGFTRAKALLFNFLTALTAVVGMIIAFIIGNTSTAFLTFLIPFTAGGFIYIAGSDLIPELHKESSGNKAFLYLLGLLLGTAVMVLLKIYSA